MTLEAVWLKKGKEVHKVDPVMNIVCDDDMEAIADIEIKDEGVWHSYGDADDFMIRVIKEK